MKTLNSIMGNSQKLDGGSMFGNAPKALWSRWVTVDSENRIDLCCRALLIQDGEKNILLETGIGNFFEPVLKDRYGVIEAEHVLLNSLQQIGLQDTDIDIIILSHLHFDHAGGLLTPWQEHKASELLFPKAKYMVSKAAWERACQPHFRDRASFIAKLNKLLADSERLEIIDSEKSSLLGKDYKFHFSNGHTPGLLLTEIAMPEGPIVFAADLIPGTPWVHLPITMGYDRYPELLIDEKQSLLEDLLTRDGRLFYTHDPETALSNIELDAKGRYQASHKLYTVSELHQ